jgi:Xaa-Pro aminopeptidase
MPMDLTSNDYDNLIKVLPKNLQSKVVSAEKLAVSWLETRTEKEMVIYQQICRIAHNIIQEGFSDKVIQPGVTTTEDVEWWYRERIKELKLTRGFIQLFPRNEMKPMPLMAKRPQPLVIQPGDFLHVDFGITYLRFNTDTQQHAYLLKAGETEVPTYLKRLLLKEIGCRIC